MMKACCVYHEAHGRQVSTILLFDGGRQERIVLEARKGASEVTQPTNTTLEMKIGKEYDNSGTDVVLVQRKGETMDSNGAIC